MSRNPLTKPLTLTPTKASKSKTAHSTQALSGSPRTTVSNNINTTTNSCPSTSGSNTEIRISNLERENAKLQIQVKQLTVDHSVIQTYVF